VAVIGIRENRHFKGTIAGDRLFASPLFENQRFEKCAILSAEFPACTKMAPMMQRDGKMSDV
jgi:hypothetical protein